MKTLEQMKGAMTLMNLFFDPPANAEIADGHVYFRKRNIRAQNRRLKLTEPRQRVHTFFDDDGNEARKEIAPVLDPIHSEPVNEGYEAHSSSIDDDPEQPVSPSKKNLQYYNLFSGFRGNH